MDTTECYPSGIEQENKQPALGGEFSRRVKALSMRYQILTKSVSNQIAKAQVNFEPVPTWWHDEDHKRNLEPGVEIRRRPHRFAAARTYWP
jgi:hypothetical protein